jgi:transketolase
VVSAAKPKATREAFGEALVKAGHEFPNVVALDADLSKSTKTDAFAKAFPQRFFEMGIEEANMIGVAAGLALSGKVPFACSFACFLTGRFDQIKLSIAYSGANVRLVGSHSGVGIGDDGYSQQGLEDVALMRSLPTMAVIQPADDLETEGAVAYLAGTHRGPAFLRTTRQKVERVNPDGYRFEFGRAVTLRDGADVTVFATGGTVMHALAAARALDGRLSVRVVNVHTIKPLDATAVERCARETGRCVTVEDAQVIGGLGSAVCETLAGSWPVPVKRLGIQDLFGESGSPEALYERHGIDARGITESVSAFCAATPPRRA